jgi:DNA-binding CsgD family transcriptional regulator
MRRRNCLEVSEEMMKSHQDNIFRKLGLQSRLEAVTLLVDSKPF